MRKSLSRKTVIIVLALFLTLSVGYALFSETITIEGTATAKGDFDIEATCDTNVTVGMLNNFGITDDKDGTVAERYKDHGYKDVSCNVSDDTVTYSVGFDYPGAVKYYIIKMKNVGGIPAYFDLVDFTEEEYNANIIKKYNTQGDFIETINSRDLIDWGDKSFVHFYGAFMAQNTNGEYYSMDSSEFETNFVVDSTKVKLESGESLYLLMESEWPDEEVFLENDVKYVATSSFTIPWQQYTE